VPLLALAASATDWTEFETFLGYSFVHSRFKPFGPTLFGAAFSSASVPVFGAVLPPAIILPPTGAITARLTSPVNDRRSGRSGPPVFLTFMIAA